MKAIFNVKAPKARKAQHTTPVYWNSQLFSQHVVLQKWASSQDLLTSLKSNKVKFELHSSHQQAIDKIKNFIGTEILLC
jgi:hypothetical protein